MPANPREFYRVREVAKARGIKQSIVLSWIATNQLAAIDCSARPGGRPRWRISPAALEAFDTARSVRPTPKVPRIRRRKKPGIIQFF